MHAKTRRVPARLMMIFGGIFILVLLVHLGGVAATRYFSEKVLHPALPKGTYIGEVHLNLFSGNFEVDGFELKVDGRQRLRFGMLKADINPWRLLQGVVQIDEVELRHGYARVERRPDGSFDLGLPPFGDPGDAPAPDKAAEPLDLRLGGVLIDRFTLDYGDGELNSLLVLENLKVGAYLLRQKEQLVPVSWQLQWDGRAIGGEADIRLSATGIGAAGRLQTALLDLEKGQRLARMQPLAKGALSFAGPFDWSSPNLTLSGVIKAPTLRYDADGQQVHVRDFVAEDFKLDLELTPALNARLALGKGLRAGGFSWLAGEQGADIEKLDLNGAIDYQDGRSAVAEALNLKAAILAWKDSGRTARLNGLSLSGKVEQALGDAMPLPLLNARLAASTLQYTDTASDLGVDLNNVRLDELGLAAAESAGDRAFNAKLQLGQSNLRQGANQVSWGAHSSTLAGLLPAAGEPKLQAEVTIDSVTAAAPALPNGPLKLAKISAAGLHVDPAVRFQRLKLQGIDLPAANPAAALRIGTVTVSPGTFSEQQGVTLGEIVIDGLQTGVIRDKTGAWQHVMTTVAAPGGSAAGQPEGEGASATAGEPMAWSIAGLRVTGDSQVAAADHLNPDAKQPQFRIERLKIGALSSRAPEKDTPFELTLRPDKYAEFVIDGKVRPLAPQLALDAKGHLHGFGLSTVNGLIANDLGHRFLEGQLDDDFTITIDKNRLEMGNGLELHSVSAEEIEGKEGPPLGTAIALLEDRDGNIKLDVPVSGDLNDPNFKVLGALNPIIMKAVAGTAALAIQPLGSVLLVGSLLANQALKVTFEPALFEAGSTALDGKANKYLGQLAGKLKEKPKLAVKVCGVVAVAERKKDKKGEFVDTDEAALAIAQARADAVRTRLRSAGAGKRQLRICRPSIDQKPDAKPRVDIKF